MAGKKEVYTEDKFFWLPGGLSQEQIYTALGIYYVLGDFSFGTHEISPKFI